MRMADENYWTYKAATPTPRYEDIVGWIFNGTEEQWHSLSPGMRREILRSAVSKAL